MSGQYLVCSPNEQLRLQAEQYQLQKTIRLQQVWGLIQIDRRVGSEAGEITSTGQIKGSEE